MANPSYRVPSTDAPTFWNRDTAFGAAIGSLIASPFIGGPVGGLIGGMIGKSRMENEAENGKIVSEPTFWNKAVAVGAVLGSIALSVVAGAAALAMHLDPASAYLLMGLGSGAGLVAGGVIGGNQDKARQEKEYADAQAYVAAHGEYRGRGQGLQPEQPRAFTLTPQEAKALSTRLDTERPAHADRAQTTGVSSPQP
ncbi:MAG: hypothetical protein JO089_06190 [Alphaproteobacteria bacterium]|nr:hypothetical protein [Alphaproteobacteria bacterium]